MSRQEECIKELLTATEYSSDLEELGQLTFLSTSNKYKLDFLNINPGFSPGFLLYLCTLKKKKLGYGFLQNFP